MSVRAGAGVLYLSAEGFQSCVKNGSDRAGPPKAQGSGSARFVKER